MVALTGIECVNFQFSSVQFGLSVCKYVQFVPRGVLQMHHGGLACQRGASARRNWPRIVPEIVRTVGLLERISCTIGSIDKLLMPTCVSSQGFTHRRAVASMP